jgi:hypothetical protein
VRDKLISLLKPQASTDVKLSVVSLFLAKMMEVYDSRISSLEARQLERGEKGDKGDAGKDGLPGPQGIQGIPGKDGLDGKDGKPGSKGTNGKDGVSVVDAEIAADDHLVLKLSNGKEIDVGELPKPEANGMVAVSGNAWQITVSATAPAHPQLNDLWLDIS